MSEEGFFMVRFVVTFGGCFLGTFAARWLLGRSLLMSENRRLHAWIEKQARAPELGPHRTPGVLRVVHDEGKIVPREFVSMEVTHVDGRPVPPPPTSIPSGGRKVEE